MDVMHRYCGSNVTDVACFRLSPAEGLALNLLYDGDYATDIPARCGRVQYDLNFGLHN